MAVKQEQRVAPTPEKTLLDQMLTVSCMVYAQVLREQSADNLTVDGLSSLYLQRLNDALIGMVRFSDLKARSRGQTIDDPETAWVNEARDCFVKLSEQVPETNGIDSVRLFSSSDDAQYVQRQLYHETLLKAPSEQPEDWTSRPLLPLPGLVV